MKYLLALVLALTFTTARADNLVWRFTNTSHYTAAIEFHAQDGSWVWPGHDQAFSLNDNDKHTFNLSCPTGKMICYGAWTTPNHQYYWGVGFNNNNDCEKCCIRCGGNPPDINLNVNTQ